LRRQADQFVDIADLEQLICRDPATRADRGGDRPAGTRQYTARGPNHAPREAGTFQENDDLSEEV
jgi:hypothetical protein